jgi:hypothetical protein
MDPATLALIETGFSIAGKFLDRFTGTPPAEDPGKRVHELDQFVKTSVAELDQSITSGISTVINKIETDNLEFLLSRARNLSALLDVGRFDQALQYAMTLRESVDYARNRLEEEKVHWLGPYLAGSGIYFAAVDAAGASREADVLAFRKHLDQIKIEVLDHVVPRMIEANVKVPWTAIAHFTLGTTDQLADLLRHLPDSEVAGTPVVDSRRITRSSTPSRLSALPQADLSVHALAVESFQSVREAYVSPKIPKAKLDGAHKKVLPLADPGDPILALLDLTVWGGAKECVAVFSSYLIIGSSGRPKRYEYDSLTSEITTRGTEIQIGGDRHFVLRDDTAAALSAFLNTVRSRT